MDFSKLDGYLASTFGAEGRVGCDVLIQQNHRVLYRRQFGRTDIETGAPVIGNERYNLYSCTKPVTSAAAMRLIEEGKINLDDPVSKYIPAFKDAHVIQDGKRVPVVMTVKHLFTMTAGFDYSMAQEPIRELFTSGRVIGTVDFAKAAIASPLNFAPGDKYQYSICLDVLGAVIEVASGMPFGDYLKKIILEPLGMTKTGFISQLGIYTTAPLYCYNQQSKTIGRVEAYRFGLYDRFESGGAGLISTIEDYGRFADTMASNGTSSDGYRLLKPESIRLMRTEQLTGFAKDPTFSCAAGPGYGYGLGVRTLADKSQGARSPLGEFGWDGAAGSYVMLDADNGLSIVLTTHLLAWNVMLGCPHAPVRDLTYEILGL